MKEIILKTGEKALVDDCVFGYLSKFKWQKVTSASGSNVYARRSFRKFGRTHSILMHREILNCEGFIDHKDGNGLNNQLENIRECTASQNMWNRVKNKNGSSIYKGVQWWKNQNKWAVRISKHKKRFLIGYFDNEIDAAKAYNEASKRLHGEFSNSNKL